jgi:undecaprenyl-diphosphatase
VPRFSVPDSSRIWIAFLAALIFAWIASAAAYGAPRQFDIAVRAAIHSLASPNLTRFMRGVTLLGSGWFLWPFGAIVVWRLVFANWRYEGARFAAIVLGANLLDEGLKLLFHRARPDAFFGVARPSTYSFPSGHSFVSFCFYLALASVIVRTSGTERGRSLIWCAAALLIALIGLSRIYLGVHYPTDVLGGYAGGAAWFSVASAPRTLKGNSN